MAPMSRGTPGTWCQASKMRNRIGWELWLGADQWALITDVHIEVPRGFRTVHPLGWASEKVKYFAPTEEELLTGIQG